MKNIRVVERYSTRLREALSDKGMKSVELSEITSIPRPAISQYLNDVIVPKQKRNHIIANALGVNPVWLYGYDVKKHLHGDIDRITSEASNNEAYCEICISAIGLNDDCYAFLLKIIKVCKEKQVSSDILDSIEFA